VERALGSQPSNFWLCAGFVETLIPRDFAHGDEFGLKCATPAASIRLRRGALRIYNTTMMFHKAHAALMFLAAALAQGQAKLEFEVASIKPAVAAQIAATPYHMKVNGARVDIGDAPLDILICYAYRVKTYQVSVPIALNKARFDILAKIPEGALKEQVPEMLQSLLANRFKLVFHRQNRETAIYALVVAKGGPKLKESADEPDPAAAVSGRLPDGSAIAHTAGGDRVRLASGSGGVLLVESPRMKMAGLADMVQRFVDRPVVDMTELNGYFQIAFDTSLWGAKGLPQTAAQPDLASDPGPALVFTSIQKLGLRLEARKGPVEMIVVESAETKPRPD
jgi:uncharacterized protein (TIGR03435 family)